MARARRGGQLGFETGALAKLELWRRKLRDYAQGKGRRKEDKTGERNGEREIIAAKAVHPCIHQSISHAPKKKAPLPHEQKRSPVLKSSYTWREERE